MKKTFDDCARCNHLIQCDAHMSDGTHKHRGGADPCQVVGTNYRENDRSKPTIKEKYPKTPVGIRSARVGEKKAEWARKDNYKPYINEKYPLSVVGTCGDNIKIPAMFNRNERDRTVWREGILKGKGYRIKMTPQAEHTKEKPIYVKTRGDMKKILLDYPRVHFKLTELK